MTTDHGSDSRRIKTQSPFHPLVNHRSVKPSVLCMQTFANLLTIFFFTNNTALQGCEHFSRIGIPDVVAVCVFEDMELKECRSIPPSIMLVCYASGCTTQPAVISLVALQEDAAAIRARLMSGLPLEHLLHASKVNVTANTKQIYHKSYVIGTSEEHVARC